jgi:hypothetical protein
MLRFLTVHSCTLCGVDYRLFYKFRQAGIDNVGTSLTIVGPDIILNLGLPTEAKITFSGAPPVALYISSWFRCYSYALCSDGTTWNLYSIADKEYKATYENLRSNIRRFLSRNNVSSPRDEKSAR